jgi:hypothetical protein
MALEKETATYQRELPSLLDRSGSYVLIHGDHIASVWQTYEDAIQEGYRVFGLQPFMVKKIQLPEVARRFTRDIGSVCRS